jgi:D-alanyl-D-alanine carboxypeptidase/D-alanyl-D-alanine-endopeptidase (penicillin-binding protein 4)
MRLAPLALALCMLTAGALSSRTGQGAPAGEAEKSSTAKVALEERLDHLLEAKFLDKASVSIRVLDLESGQVLFDRNATAALNPASNVKLLTSAAALTLLGPEHRYPTRVYAEKGKLSGGTLSSDIYLVGGGDPSLVTGDLYELALRLRAAGVKKVQGGITVDATRFDGDGLPPGFDQKEEFASYRAPFGAAAVNYDTFEVRLGRGGALGDAPPARLVPSARSFTIDNRAKIVAGRKNKLQVSVETRGGKTKITIKGDIGENASPPSYRYPVEDPSDYAGQVFESVMRQAGIKLTRRTIKRGKKPASARLLASHYSEPLSVLLRAVNKFSNNFMAEQILRTLDEGAGASANDSLTRLRSYAAQVGIATDTLVLGNGSGLYDNNRISAEAFTKLLAAVYDDFTIRADFLASLSVMGVDGTGRKRLSEDPSRGWVRVKTGTLDGVSALSGYVGVPGRRPVVLSILLNDLPKWKTVSARKLQDEIVAEIAAELHGAPRPVADK